MKVGDKGEAGKLKEREIERKGGRKKFEGKSEVCCEHSRRLGQEEFEK